ncbi:hypothetical protein Tco_0966036 [Tanacetum coccineum]
MFDLESPREGGECHGFQGDKGKGGITGAFSNALGLLVPLIGNHPMFQGSESNSELGYSGVEGIKAEEELREPTQKYENKVDELRAVFDHMLGASEVQIPKNNLDNLKLTREEDGAMETLDPQFCMGCELLEMLDSTPLDLLLKLILVTSLSISGLFLRGVVFFATFIRSGFLGGHYISGGGQSLNHCPTKGPVEIILAKGPVELGQAITNSIFKGGGGSVVF